MSPESCSLLTSDGLLERASSVTPFAALRSALRIHNKSWGPFFSRVMRGIHRVFHLLPLSSFSAISHELSASLLRQIFVIGNFTTEMKLTITKQLPTITTFSRDHQICSRHATTMTRTSLTPGPQLTWKKTMTMTHLSRHPRPPFPLGLHKGAYNRQVHTLVSLPETHSEKELPITLKTTRNLQSLRGPRKGSSRWTFLQT